MSNVPDAWEDEWSAVVDQSPKLPQEADQEIKKPSTKVTKAQKRAQQAEFNKQFWAEAEGPAQPNYFLESRNVVPLRQEYKPPPILLSRKGPILQTKPKSQSPLPPTDGLNSLSITPQLTRRESSDEDEEETEESRRKALEQRQAQAAKDREEKQRKYEERRLELFGPPAANGGGVGGNVTTNNSSSGIGFNSRSGTSSPASNTPPHSRSSTPSNRGRRGRGGRGTANNISGGGAHHLSQQSSQRTQQPQIQYQIHQQQQQQQQQQFRELYDPQYSIRPESVLQRQQQNSQAHISDIQPIRTPRGPDGSGRGGFGFAARGAKVATTATAGPVEIIASTRSA